MLNIFHILLHVFEILFIWILIVVEAKLLGDYEALKGWIEIGMNMDLNRLKENIDKFNKEHHCGDIV